MPHKTNAEQHTMQIEVVMATTKTERGTETEKNESLRGRECGRGKERQMCPYTYTHICMCI